TAAAPSPRPYRRRAEPAPVPPPRRARARTAAAPSPRPYRRRAEPAPVPPPRGFADAAARWLLVGRRAGSPSAGVSVAVSRGERRVVEGPGSSGRCHPCFRVDRG
ncbi:hypothetical protein RM698_27190, partial [Streptomyces sp. DSM 41979]|nr:hypothetical protein [Streptomyces sp. DSM 41979]